MEKIVDFSKLSIKKIRELIVFTALIVVALRKFDAVLLPVQLPGDYQSAG